MKKVLVIILSLVLLTSLFACNSADTDQPVQTPDTQTPDGQTPGDDVVRVGVSMPTKSGERWIRDGDAIKAGLEALVMKWTFNLQKTMLMLRFRRLRI
jgi:putative multiple sugar transport system substrate-binding protein